MSRRAVMSSGDRIHSVVELLSRMFDEHARHSHLPLSACPARHVFTVHCHDQHSVSPPQRRASFFLFPDSFFLGRWLFCFWDLLFTLLAFSADKLVLVLADSPCYSSLCPSKVCSTRPPESLPTVSCGLSVRGGTALRTECFPLRRSHATSKVVQHLLLWRRLASPLLVQSSACPSVKASQICDVCPLHPVSFRWNAAALSVIGSDRTLASDGFAKCGWLFQHEPTSHVCDRLSLLAAQPSPSRPTESCHVYANLSVLFCTASFCRQ